MTLQALFFLTFLVSFLDKGFTWPSFGGDSGKNNSSNGQSLLLRNVFHSFPKREESENVCLKREMDLRQIRDNVPNSVSNKGAV